MRNKKLLDLPDADFLTRDEVRARLGISEKTIQRLVAKGQVKQFLRHRPGLQPLAVYDPTEIDILATQKGYGRNGSTAAAQPAPPQAPTQALLPAPASAVPAPVNLEYKLWLTLREAVAYSGLPIGFLKNAVYQGQLDALRIPRGKGVLIRIHRETLEWWKPSATLGPENDEG